MNDAMARSLVAKAYAQLGEGSLDENWSGVDAVLPLLERMRAEGAIVLLKLDGERRLPTDAGPYTVHVSGGPLQGDFHRTDSRTLEQGLARIIALYGRRCWGL